MVEKKKNCPRCGSNIKPECRGCPNNVGEINQRWVERTMQASKEHAQKQGWHRRNQIIRQAILTYHDEMYEEGTEI